MSRTRPATPERRPGAAGAPPPAPDDVGAGTVEHYRDAALYDHEYRRRRADVNHYRRLAAARPGARVLELGCGSGRVLVPLARDGHQVVGVDLSRPMLAAAAARLARLAPATRRRARLVQGDVRHLPVAAGAGFDLVIAAFHTLQHLYDPRAFLATLAGVRRALAPHGRFAFDVLNPDAAYLARGADRRWGRTRFRHPTDGRAYVYSTNHLYDAARQIAFIRLYYEPVGGGAARVVRLAHRMFFPRELEVLLALGGFALESRAGGFSGEPFAGTSTEQVVVAVPSRNGPLSDENG